MAVFLRNYNPYPILHKAELVVCSSFIYFFYRWTLYRSELPTFTAAFPVLSVQCASLLSVVVYDIFFAKTGSYVTSSSFTGI